MSGMDMTAYDAALKQHYIAQRVESMVYNDRPLLALMAKYEKFGGKNLPIVLNYGNPQGRSKSFTNAQTRGGVTGSLLQDFLLTRAKDYAVATIDNETLEASKNDADAFMAAATVEINGAIREISNSMAINAYRDSSAWRGQLLAEPTEDTGSFVVTLKNADDVVNFEVGQVYVSYAAKTGGSALHSDGSDDEWVVEAVNRRTGEVTFTGDYTASGNLAANAYLFVEGDRGNGASGLEAWVPDSDPAATSFFGVDRSVDITRLGGMRLDGTDGPIEEVLIEAENLVAREGGRLDHYFMNYGKFGELKKSLGSKVQYIDLKAGSNAQISFRGVLLDGAKGPIKVIPDQFCPGNRVFGLTLDSWKWYSLGKGIRPIDTDGLTMLRQGSADGVEVRYGTYSNFGCDAPGWNINIQV